MYEFPIFTLAEANGQLPEVIRLTMEAVEQLNALDSVWGKLPFRKFNVEQGAAEDDLIRAAWARDVAALGVQPKGFFVVDFQSPDPNTVYCWTFGELEVGHEHKIWETFTDRRPLGTGHDFPFEPPSHRGAPGALGDDTARGE